MELGGALAIVGVAIALVPGAVRPSARGRRRRWLRRSDRRAASAREIVST